MDNISPLEFSPGNKYVFLKEITGFAEQIVSGINPINVILLIDECINKKIKSDFTVNTASLLTIPDRERVLATLYEITYGPHINLIAKCRVCNHSIDFVFKLNVLIESIKPDLTIPRKEVDGIFVFTTDSGLSFRLCTGIDELAVLGMLPETTKTALLLRCLIDGDKEKAIKDLPQAIRQVAPQIETDLKISCPECESKQKHHFNFQNHFLNILANEKELLTAEINRLALNYKWGVNEILSLPRSLRRSILLDLKSNGLEQIITNKDEVSIKGNVKVTLDAPQIDLVENASHPIVLGDELLNYLNEITNTFNTHLHPGELAFGRFPITPSPPVPPLLPATSSIISKKVKSE